MRDIDEENVKLAQSALEQVIEKAGNCEDREELERIATDVFSAKLAEHPALIKRACEAFNSNKSVYKLSNSPHPDRDFALLSGDRIVANIRKSASARELKKAANLHPKFYSTPEPTKASPVRSVKKEASAFNPSSEIELDDRPSFGDVTIMNVLSHQQDVMNKLAFACDHAKDACFKAKEALRKEANKLGRAERAEVAGICKAYYGSLFEDADKIFATDVPLRKFASAPVLPDTNTYKLVQDYVEKKYLAYNYGVLSKTAAQDIGQTLRKLAGAYNLRKKAAIASSLQGLVAGTAVGEALGFRNSEDAEVRESILNDNVKNVLRELEMKRNFYEIYNDDYISTFPVYQVQDAYNDAIQKLPDRLRKHPSSATQLIRSWVTKQLSHGGVPSAEDAADIFEAQKSFRNMKEDDLYA